MPAITGRESHRRRDIYQDSQNWFGRLVASSEVNQLGRLLVSPSEEETQYHKGLVGEWFTFFRRAQKGNNMQCFDLEAIQAFLALLTVREGYGWPRENTLKPSVETLIEAGQRVFFSLLPASEQDILRTQPDFVELNPPSEHDRVLTFRFIQQASVVMKLSVGFPKWRKAFYNPDTSSH